MYYLLFYEVVGDYVERRSAFREAHLKLTRAAQERGELLLGGALADPVDGAVLLFAGNSPAVAERFAENDPYILSGLVTTWRVRGWTVVIGALHEAGAPADDAAASSEQRATSNAADAV